MHKVNFSLNFPTAPLLAAVFRAVKIQRLLALPPIGLGTVHEFLLLLQKEVYDPKMLWFIMVIAAS